MTQTQKFFKLGRIRRLLALLQEAESIAQIYDLQQNGVSISATVRGITEEIERQQESDNGVSPRVATAKEAMSSAHGITKPDA